MIFTKHTDYFDYFPKSVNRPIFRMEMYLLDAIINYCTY